MSKEDLTEDNINKTLYLALERILVDKIAEKTPFKTGHTAGSWEIEQRGNKFFLVNTNGQVARYLEEGTKPHIIRPKNKKSLRFKGKGGGDIFAKEVKHPGFKGRFFIKKVLDDPKVWDEINEFTSKRFTKS